MNVVKIKNLYTHYPKIFVQHVFEGVYVEQHEDEIDDFPFVATLTKSVDGVLITYIVEFTHLIPINSKAIKLQIVQQLQ